MGRDYDYINISKPQARSPGLSHDLQLLRDLEIANARTVVQLGPLPPGGFALQPKGKPGMPYQPLPAPADHETMEDETMKWNQAAAIAAMTTGLAACEPSPATNATEQPSATTQASSQASSIVPEPKVVQKAAAVPESAAGSAGAAVVVPDEIRAFVPPDSTLLAYRRFDLTGDGNEDAVLIVRHPIADGSRPDFSKNPCDLIVLHCEASGFKIAAKGSKIVDCTYKLYARESASKHDSLNSIFELKNGEIALTQEKDRPTGINTYYWFRYSKKKGAWHLSEAEATYSSYDIIGGTGRRYFASEKVRYPTDIRFIDIDSFDPDDLTEAYERNRKVEFEEDDVTEEGPDNA